MKSSDEKKHSESQTPDDSDSNASFHQFLLAEYNNIAQAHFNTVDSLANFIKHYIVIASIPFAAAVVFFNVQQLDTEGVLRLINQHPIAAALFFSAVSLIGLLVLGYVINIRLDAILYARTVNGIRKYFFDRSSLDLIKGAEGERDPLSHYRPPVRRAYEQVIAMIYHNFKNRAAAGALVEKILSKLEADASSASAPKKKARRKK